jgi:hypothetical protein
MRPRISDATAREAYIRQGGQDAAAHCAVMEARSILAAEEPLRHRESFHVSPDYWNDGALGRTARILAASLAAFDTLTIEELRVLQVCPTATFNG